MTRLSRKTLILIPAYNEETNIATVLNNIHRECGDVDILVINYEYIIQMDADGQHDVCNIGTIYKELSDPYNHYDIVIGSRFLADDNEMKVGLAKRIAINFFNMAIRLVTHKRFTTDPTSGLQGLSRRAFTA